MACTGEWKCNVRILGPLAFYSMARRTMLITLEPSLGRKHLFLTKKTGPFGRERSDSRYYLLTPEIRKKIA